MLSEYCLGLLCRARYRARAPRGSLTYRHPHGQHIASMAHSHEHHTRTAASKLMGGLSNEPRAKAYLY